MWFFSDNFHRYEWLTLSGRVWTHVTASRWPKCCANSRASARDCLRRRAAAAADRRPKPAEAVAPAPADPSNTLTATMRLASLTSTLNVFRRTATRKRLCKSFLLLIIIIIILLFSFCRAKNTTFILYIHYNIGSFVYPSPHYSLLTYHTSFT